MPTTNYNSPNGMYPLETVDNKSTARGAGTVPGSFLAGWNLPDRMQDYRTAQDLSFGASRLANEHMQDTNTDYRLAGPSRLSSYDLLTGQNKNAIGLLSDQQNLAKERLSGELRRAPEENKAKLEQAINALPMEQRREYMAKLEHIGTILEAYSDENGKLLGDPNIIAADLKKNYGIDISPQHMSGVRRILPDIRKANQEMRKQQNMDAAHMDRTKAEQEGANYRAELGAGGKGSAAEAKIKAMEELRNKVRPIIQKVKAKIPISPQEATELQFYNDTVNEVNNRYIAQSQAQMQEGLVIIKRLEGDTSADIQGGPKIDTGQHPTEDQIKIRQELGKQYEPEKYKYSRDGQGNITREKR